MNFEGGQDGAHSEMGGIGLGATVLIVAVASASIFLSERIIAKVYPLPPSHIRAAQGPEAVARGDKARQGLSAARIVTATICTALSFRDFGMPSRNLTLLAKDFSDADFDRVIRHGLRPDGTSVAETMPSDAFQYMTDADVSDVIAYIRSRPPSGEAGPHTIL